MGIITHEYLNNASIILGILTLLVCLYGDIPEPHKSLWIIALPIMLVINYVCLQWLTKKKELFKL